MLHGSDMGGRKLIVKGMKKAAAFWSKKKKKPPTSPTDRELHDHEVKKLHDIADRYEMNRDHVIEEHGEHHKTYPNATEHNVAAYSDLYRRVNGRGVEWDHKKWGGPNPLRS